MKAKQSVPNTPKLSEDAKEKLIKMIENDLWGLVCSCGGGGTNEENETCNLCDGTGITDWKHEPLIGEFEKLLAQELSTLKAKVRKEIEEQITKMENSNWLHGMGLSGSQAEYIEANIKASYRSIESLKGGE